MQYNNHPQLTHDFSRQFAKVACPDSDARASALPAFIALHKMKAQLRLYIALNQCLQMKPRMGLLNKPAQFGASTPSGQGATGIIIGYDEKGQLRCTASNALPEPTACKPNATIQTNLIDKISARNITATARLDLMNKAISVAAKDKMDWVGRVRDEGFRHRISPIFLLVIDTSEAHFYCTTALIDVTAAQTDLSRQWTGQTLL